jgi:hypothetical protein
MLKLIVWIIGKSVLECKGGFIIAFSGLPGIVWIGSPGVAVGYAS